MLSAKPDWGTRRRCSHCGSPFYDLKRAPIVCPKCGATHSPTPPSRRLRATPTGTDVEPAVAAARDAEAAADGDDDEVDENQEDGDEADDTPGDPSDEIEPDEHENSGDSR